MAASPKAEPAVPDLSLVLDPASLWPNPEDCPDWPLQDRQSSLYNAVLGKADAVARLERIGRSLHRFGNTRPPTEAESKAAIEENFRSGAGSLNWRWDALGFTDMKPRVSSDTPLLMVEAAHIRGFLRKMEAREAEAAKAQADREERRQRDGLARSVQAAKDLEDELKSLAPAIERHQQRLDDEKAAHRAAEIRYWLPIVRSEAASASRELGIEATALPSVEGQEP